MKYVCVLLLFICGCVKDAKVPEYPALKRYALRYSVDLKAAPKGEAWQDYLYNWSRTKGPDFNKDEKKEYADFKVK